MAQPVWILSVDLQTKTATFQSGMADAAKAARGAFTEIKSGSTEMSGHVGTNMFASRHAVMAVSEAFGDTMPRAITALLVHIGPLEQALQKAFPFAAIGLAVVMLIEHFQKLKEEDQKLVLDMQNFGTAAQNAFNALDQKLLQAQIRSDELHNNHLAALHHQLELINKTSMAEIAQQFQILARSVDGVFKQMESHWYKFGIGSAGAKNALDVFQAKYEALLAHGRDKEASDLLRGTRESAEKVLAAQEEIAKNGHLHTHLGQNVDIGAVTRNLEAHKTLREAGLEGTKTELESQRMLVEALRSQESIETRIGQIKKLDSGNATKQYSNDASSRRAAAETEAAEHHLKMGELTLAADRQQSEIGMSIRNASIAEKLAADVAFADKEFGLQQKANAERIAALDKSGKDYANQLKALQDKALEIVAQHETAVTILRGKAQMEQYRQDLADMEASERQKINATRQGSQERLAVLDDSIKAEEAKNLQATQHYRELLAERVQVERELSDEQAKQAAEGGRIEADYQLKAGELTLAALLQHRALVASARRLSDQILMQQAIEAANAEYALKLAAMDQEIAALDKHGKDYENKLREIQNRQKLLTQQHENDVTAIKAQAEMNRNQRILAASNAFNNAIASSLAQFLIGHQTFAAMMSSVGSQIVSGMAQNAAKAIMANDMTKVSDASAAARKMFLAGAHFPFPTNIVMAPLLGAAAFASVMAFQSGTDGVPGVGRGDIVPTMLEPGEGVVPGGVMDGLRSMVRNGGFDRQPAPVINAPFAPVIHAIDRNGVEDMLKEHADAFHQHLADQIRRMNR